MTPEEHYTEAERITRLAVKRWIGDHEPTDDIAELAVRGIRMEDDRNEAMAYFALAQVHATLALYQPPRPARRRARTSGEGATADALAARIQWAQTEDRVAATADARQAFADSFERMVDPDRKLDPAERAQRAAAAKKAHYTRLALKSAQVRRAKAAARAAEETPDD